MVAVQDVAVGQLVVNDVVAPFKANSTTEPEVNPLPLTVKLVMLVAPSLAENGEMEAMLNAPAPLRSRSQTPRPCVAARSVREALCNVKPRICALGRDDAAPKGDQLTPPSVVKKPPMEGSTDRKSTRLNSSHANISYAVFCLKKKKHLENFILRLPEI